MLLQFLFGFGRTQTFTVHERPDHPTDRIDRAEALAFVKDGFSLRAFLFAPFWLLTHRLWIGLALYLAAVVAILGANFWLGLSAAATQIAVIGLHAIIGFEADTIERAGLESRGWTSLGSVSGTSPLDCERRFFESWLHGQPVLTTRTSQPAPQSAPTLPTPAVEVAETPRGSVAGRLAAIWRR